MRRISIISLAFLILASAMLFSKPQNSILRQSTGIFDLQKNTKSNFDFYTTNYGIHFLNVAQLKGGCFWPRGSSNQYIFGGGIWFGCLKKNPTTGEMDKYVSITYNPNTGTSWFVPGSIADGDTIVPNSANKYRTYFSTDFHPSTGNPINTNDGPNWCLWKSTLNGQYHYDTEKYDYVLNESERNSSYYPAGPFFVSDEDIVSIIKDTDLSRYDGGASFRAAKGYPLGLEIQTNIYTWENETMKDIIIMSYNIKNTSNDTLRDCYVGKVLDTDLSYGPNAAMGASNDRATYYGRDSSLNLVVTWTDTDQGELGKGFGYLGVYMLETPAVGQNGFLRTDKLVYQTNEQIGASTYRNWSIQDDFQTDNERYDFMSSKVKEGDNGPGDKRLMLSTGGFHLRPGESTRITLAIAAALPANSTEATGTYDDIEGAIGKHRSKLPGVLSSEPSLIDKVTLSFDKYYTDLFLGINEQIFEQSSIRLSPNPATNLLRIEANETSDIEVYSIRGEKLLSQSFSNELNISQLATGIYILKIGRNSSIFIKE